MNRHLATGLIMLVASAAQAQPGAASAPQAGASSASTGFAHCDVRPDYPAQALRAGVQGMSLIEATFGPDGAVTSARVARASGPLPENALLDQAALAALSHCRVIPSENPKATQQIAYAWKLDGVGDPDQMPGVQAEHDRLKLQEAMDAQLVIDADHGVVAAQLALARQYATGDRRTRDEKLASQLFRRAAEAGDVDAQVYYGQRLMVGKGVSRDDDAGIAWLRKAAAQGSGSAAYGLGIFARAGRGMRASDTEAFRWLMQAAQAGTRPALEEVADAYAKGSGTPRDDVQAARWYLAASPYSLVAIYRLGMAYRDGRGVPVDYGRAALCLAVADRHGVNAPARALDTVAPHLDAATLAAVQARADRWKFGESLFP